MLQEPHLHPRSKGNTLKGLMVHLCRPLLQMASEDSVVYQCSSFCWLFLCLQLIRSQEGRSVTLSPHPATLCYKGISAPLLPSTPKQSVSQSRGSSKGELRLGLPVSESRYRPTPGEYMEQRLHRGSLCCRKWLPGTVHHDQHLQYSIAELFGSKAK